MKAGISWHVPTILEGVDPITHPPLPVEPKPNIDKLLFKCMSELRNTFGAIRGFLFMFE